MLRDSDSRKTTPSGLWSRWQTALIVVIGIVFLAAWGAAWIVVRDRVAAQGDYYLQAEQIELTPPPPWIHSPVKAEVLQAASLDRPLSLLDDDLTRRLYEAFPVHPWIARVERVSKRYPARVVVDVVYRRPVCMVEVPGGFHPVDVESIVLPSGDFTPFDAVRFPLLRGVDSQPSPAGSTWGDDRVLEGCRLAAALSDVWMELQLASLTPLPRADDADDDPYRFEVIARTGVRIVWGLAPGAGAAEKTLVEAKVSRLRKAVQELPPHDSAPRVIHLEGLDAPGSGRLEQRP